jgi:hypothetical protein
MFVRLLSLAIIVLMAGCSGDAFPTAPLKGTVTVDGQPVERGNISFAPLAANMGPDVSVPITAGRYEAQVPQGKVRVFLQGTRETGKMIEMFGKQEPEVVSVIPRKYSPGIELDTSKLSGEHNFELTSSPDSSR